MSQKVNDMLIEIREIGFFNIEIFDYVIAQFFMYIFRLHLCRIFWFCTDIKEFNHEKNKNKLIAISNIQLENL